MNRLPLSDELPYRFQAPRLSSCEYKATAWLSAMLRRLEGLGIFSTVSMACQSLTCSARPPSVS